MGRFAAAELASFLARTLHFRPTYGSRRWHCLTRESALSLSNHERLSPR